MATITLEAAQITRVNAAQLWNPYEVLDIYPTRGNFSCIGTTRQNLRCGWQFFGKRHAISARVDEMAACEPSKIPPGMLEMLAIQCLCVDNHQSQFREKLRDWQDKVAEYLKVHYGTATRVRDVGGLQEQLRTANEEKEMLGDRVVEQEDELEDCKRTIEELEGRLEESEASVEREKLAAEKIDGLNTQLEASKKHLDDAKTEASSQIDKLEKRLKDSDRRLEEQERTSSHEIGNLHQQLRDGNEELGTLKTASSKDSEDVDHLHQEIQEMGKQYTNSKTKNDARISKLQQQNQTLKAQTQKRCEEAESTNAALTEQARRLMEQVSDLNKQLAEQNVRFSPVLVLKCGLSTC